MTFENGGLYNNIEPIPINEFISYSVWNQQIIKIKKETNRKKNNDLSLSVPGAGLEPAQPQWPKDFKSFVSTIPPSGR